MDPGEVIGLLIILVTTIGLPLIGILGGWINERRHLKSLEEREGQSIMVVVSQVKSFPGSEPQGSPPAMVFAETVIASDYLKTFFATLRGIFGGEVRSYQKIMDRARRETLLRLIADAEDQGFNALCNVRLDTADVGGGTMTRGRNAMPMAAILGSATAYHASVWEGDRA